MATVTFDKATRHLPGQRPPRGRQAQHRHRRRRVPRPRRSLRVRQVHLAAHARRPRGGQRRPHPDRRPRRHRPVAQGPRHRDGVPELRALPAHDGRRQHGLRAQDRRRRPRARSASGSRRPPRSSTSSRYLERKPKALSGGQRQRVAMGRAIVRSPAGVPHGRAAVEPRRQAPRPDPHPDRLAAAPARRHDRLRHPRPGRGHDDGRPGRGAQGRPPPAVRHPARDVRPPGQRLRRRLHRLPRDEPRLDVPVADGGVQFGEPPHARSTRDDCSRAAGNQVTVGVRPEDLELTDERAGPGESRSTSSRSSAPTPTSTADPGQRTSSSRRGDEASPSRSSPASTAARPPEKGADPSTLRRRARATLHLFHADTRRCGLGRLTASHPTESPGRGVHRRGGSSPGRPAPRPSHRMGALTTGGPWNSTAARPDPALLDLPWSVPLEDWPADIAGRPAARHLPARRAVRPALRPGARRQGDQGRPRPPRVRHAAQPRTARTCRASSRSVS